MGISRVTSGIRFIPLPVVINNQALCSIDRRMEFQAWIEKHAIQIDTPGVSAIVSPVHTIRIEHGNELEDKMST